MPFGFVPEKGDVVARSDAEIGIQQISEMLAIQGIDYVGPLPPEIQKLMCSPHKRTAVLCP